MAILRLSLLLVAISTTLVIEGCGQPAEVTGAAKNSSSAQPGVVHPTITAGPKATSKTKTLSGPPMSMEPVSGGNLLTPGSKVGN